MVRVPGPSLELLEKRRKQFKEIFMDAVRKVTNNAAKSLNANNPSLSDISGVMREWSSIVDSDLVPDLEDVWIIAAVDMRERIIATANFVDSLTAAIADIPPVRNTRAEQYLATRRNFLVAIGNEVWEIIRAQLLEGFEEGESIQKLRDRIIASVQFSAYRATVVARTEVVGASNAGSFEQIIDSGLEATKEWIATDDSRTRPTHRAIDGTVVDLHDSFIVGGFPMARPLDPIGPLSEIVQCRCTLGYDIPEENLLASVSTKDNSYGTLSTNVQGDAMPWSIEKNHSECSESSPWAVVKKGTGEVEGCHESEEDAQAQLAALFASEEETTGETKPLKENTNNFAQNDNNDDKSDCPPGHHRMPDGECMDDDAMSIEDGAVWEGILAVEDVPTGDGREFKLNALSWPDLPIPLRWNKEDSHGGEPHTVAVNVGRIDEIWRENNFVKGKGIFDINGENGKEAYRLVKEEFLRGVSVDVDDVSDADVEMIFPEDDNDFDPGLDSLFMMPEKTIFHKGRIRAATLVDIPAFTEAYISLLDNDNTESVTAAMSLTFGPVASHKTETTDASWDGPANEGQLPSPVSLSNARAAYAWIADDAQNDDEITKNECKFIHHMIDSDGNVGPANLTACSSGIAVLNGARGGTSIPRKDWQGIYNHLASHLRDAGQEPPPADFSPSVVSALSVVDDRPPSEWFSNPKLSLPTSITVNENGRIYGHAAMWDECHIGHNDICVTAPHEDDHPYFMTGEITCSDDSIVSVGQITLGTGHAPLSLNASRASEHYDNTGTAVADIVVGNDEYGIWISGAVRSDAPNSRIRDLRASGQVSGDWRRIGGELRLVGLLAVNVPGFPVPKRATRVASGASLALVAAGKITVGRPIEDEKESLQRAMNIMRDRLIARVNNKKEEEINV